jgi:negative regulator of sigma E activity
VKDPELIDRLYDADLDEAQAKRARERLAVDPRAAAHFERLQLIGSLVREVEAERELPPDFTDRVMARIEPAGPSRRASKLYPLVAAAAGSALALAAAVALWVRAPAPPGVPSSLATALGVPALSAPALPDGDALSLEVSAEPPSVSIESVDFGATQGAIFLVSAGVTDTMVVWTLDEEAPTGRRR